VNFPEENLPEVQIPHIQNICGEAIHRISTLQKTAKHGIILRDGLRIAIVGLPNMGKSSLFNALLEKERAIVTSVSGTTRDTIEESIDLNGIPVVLTDTAGITVTEDVVEKIGVQRSIKAIDEADLILLVLDSQASNESEEHFFSKLEPQVRYMLDKKPIVKVNNKADLERAKNQKKDGDTPLSLSALTGEGLTELRNHLYETFIDSELDQESHIVTNIRHITLLDKTFQSLHDALNGIESSLDVDTLSIDIEQAVSSLGEILGIEIDEELLNIIFGKFCIGK